MLQFVNSATKFTAQPFTITKELGSNASVAAVEDVKFSIILNNK